MLNYQRVCCGMSRKNEFSRGGKPRNDFFVSIPKSEMIEPKMKLSKSEDRTGGTGGTGGTGET